MQTIAGTGMIVTLKMKDIRLLEMMFAKPISANDEGLVYGMPEWLVNLRRGAKERDAALLSPPV